MGYVSHPNADGSYLEQPGSTYFDYPSRSGSYANQPGGGYVPWPRVGLSFLANVVLWYEMDPNFMVFNGDQVASIINRGSAAGNMTAAGATNEGTFVEQDSGFGNDGSLLLDGVDNYYTLPDLSSYTSGEVFIVGRKAADPASSGSKAGAWNLGDQVNSTHVPFADGVVYDGTGTTARKNCGDPAASLASPFVYNVSSAAGAWSCRLNGTELHATAVNTVSWPAAPSFGINAAANAFYDGWLRCLVFCSSVQSAAARTTFLARYGF